MPEAGGGIRSFILEYLVANVALPLAADGELARGASVLHLHNPPDTFFLAAGWALGRTVDPGLSVSFGGLRR